MTTDNQSIGILECYQVSITKRLYDAFPNNTSVKNSAELLYLRNQHEQTFIKILKRNTDHKDIPMLFCNLEAEFIKSFPKIEDLHGYLVALINTSDALRESEHVIQNKKDPSLLSKFIKLVKEFPKITNIDQYESEIKNYIKNIDKL